MSINTDRQMQWAEGEIGFREGPNNENPYGIWQGVRNAAYCDSFAQMAAVFAGAFAWPDHCQFGYKGDAYCPYTEAHAKELGIWHPKGDGYKPKRGDQMLYDWTGWGGADHIETYWGYETGGHWNIGANAGSPQGVHWFMRDFTYLRGIVALSDLGTVQPPSGPREMRKGMEGDDVHWLQSRLTDLGYHVPGGIDGVFGDGTEQAVMNFQNDWCRPVDGICGASTRAALANDAFRADMQQPEPPKPSYPPWPGVFLRYGSKGDHVRTVQNRLKERGWNITVDGWFGSGTRRVVIGFQTNKNLTVDGIVGQDTWNALWTEPVT